MQKSRQLSISSVSASCLFDKKYPDIVFMPPSSLESSFLCPFQSLWQRVFWGHSLIFCLHFLKAFIQSPQMCGKKHDVEHSVHMTVGGPSRLPQCGAQKSNKYIRKWECVITADQKLLHCWQDRERSEKQRTNSISKTKRGEKISESPEEILG